MAICGPSRTCGRAPLPAQSRRRLPLYPPVAAGLLRRSSPRPGRGVDIELIEWPFMVGLLGLRPRPVAAEPPPETTTLRLVHNPGICTAPYFVAAELLA